MEPQQTTYDSNTCVLIRKVTNKGHLTYLQCACWTNFTWCSTSYPKCHTTFSKTKMNVDWHLHFLLKYHLHFTCLVACVISMSIDIWFNFFLCHTTCQILNCVCHCVKLHAFFFQCKFLHVKCEKLAKTLSKIHIAYLIWESCLVFYHTYVFLQLNHNEIRWSKSGCYLGFGFFPSTKMALVSIHFMPNYQNYSRIMHAHSH